MESEFLENLWFALEIAAKSFTELLYFLHSLYKLLTWLAGNILHELVRLVYLISNFLYRDLHSFC